MAGGLSSLLVSLAGPLVKKALSSIGIGIVSYAAISTALNAALDGAKSAIGGFTGDALSIIQLSGVFTALSIVAGAMIAKAALDAVSKLELLK